MMLWVKSFHIIFMVTWFAGLFYLPRLFVYHAMTDEQTVKDQFVIMEKKLLAIMTIGAIATWLFAIWILILAPDFFKQGWLHVKITLVILLTLYHVWCYKIARQLKAGENKRSHVWFRWFNEFPALILILAIVLVELKPF